MNDTPDATAPNPVLEQAFEAALDGSREGAARFFDALIDGPLFVPERQQQYPLSDAPDYPDEYFNFLGVQDGERAFVPAFSDPKLIQDWCGNELAYRSVSGSRLFDVLPDEWWVIYNPGSDAGKELSPWEVKQLKIGKEAIPEVVDENFSSDSMEALRVEPLEKGAYEDLQNALSGEAVSLKEVHSLALLKESGIDAAGEPVETLLLGVHLAGKIPDNRKVEIATRLRRVAEPLLIADCRLRIVSGTPAESSHIGLFETVAHFYERKSARPGSLFQQLLNNKKSD